jgi:hypothetical protein
MAIYYFIIFTFLPIKKKKKKGYTLFSVSPLESPYMVPFFLFLFISLIQLQSVACSFLFLFFFSFFVRTSGFSVRINRSTSNGFGLGEFFFFLKGCHL